MHGPIGALTDWSERNERQPRIAMHRKGSTDGSAGARAGNEDAMSRQERQSLPMRMLSLVPRRSQPEKTRGPMGGIGAREMSEAKITNDEELKAAIACVSMDPRSPLNFKWKFRYVAGEFDPDHLGEPVRRCWLLWAEFERFDVATGEKGIGRGRDEIIWWGTTLSGVVKTAWVIVKMLVEHELMHAFLFDGKPLFDPHASGGGSRYRRFALLPGVARVDAAPRASSFSA